MFVLSGYGPAVSSGTALHCVPLAVDAELALLDVELPLPPAPEPVLDAALAVPPALAFDPQPKSTVPTAPRSSNAARRFKDFLDCIMSPITCVNGDPCPPPAKTITLT